MHEAESTPSFDDSIEPSEGFVDRVMTAVRREARAPAPIPFPWRISAAGALLAIASAHATIALSARGLDILPGVSLSLFPLDAPLLGLGTAVALVSLALAAAANWYVARSE